MRVQPTTAELSLLDINPFIQDGFRVQISKRSSPNTYVRDAEGHLLPKEWFQEYERPVRLYINDDLRKKIAMLGKPAATLLLFIMYELKPSKDYVVINPQRFMQETMQKTDTGYTKGVLELQRYQFIASTVLKNVFWINPRIMFRGSRIEKYGKYAGVVVEVKEKQVKEDDPTVRLVQKRNIRDKEQRKTSKKKEPKTKQDSNSNEFSIK